ncbi:hypothetical protein CVT24_012277 [Panaeolus cyanescens]|uniref:Uncharacterized protein n=1 Tax=Panaeolus cyanescens TaxID=181874 RepID=A0A409X329_9AGAR|nr:hypothetical protein CVT24_012277 [Panaeolus cyanescens]
MNLFHHTDNKYYNLNPPNYVVSQTTATSSALHRSVSTISGDSMSSGESGVIKSIANRLLERQDPVLVQARQRLLDAEAVEKEADRAYHEAKQRVKQARRDLRRLEHQTREEARRIRSTQLQGQQMTSGFMQVRRR